MTPRLFDTLVAAVIRVGLLLALVIMLMAENAQAQSPALNPTALPIAHGLAVGNLIPQSHRAEKGWQQTASPLHTGA